MKHWFKRKENRWLSATILGVVVLLILLGHIVLAHARDLGQWENTDPKIHEWYKKLMRPDVPGAPCCAEADAYWADKVVIRDGKTFATITDDRDDGPLGRPHVANGTTFEIPPEKLKWDNGNPTGHNILFISVTGFTWCFVQASGA